MKPATFDKLIGLTIFLVGVAVEVFAPRPSQVTELVGALAIMAGLLQALNAQILGPIFEKLLQTETQSFLGNSGGLGLGGSSGGGSSTSNPPANPRSPGGSEGTGVMG